MFAPPSTGPCLQSLPRVRGEDEGERSTCRAVPHRAACRHLSHNRVTRRYAACCFNTPTCYLEEGRWLSNVSFCLSKDVLVHYSSSAVMWNKDLPSKVAYVGRRRSAS
jgi:hypothetical protein